MLNTGNWYLGNHLILNVAYYLGNNHLCESLHPL